MIIMIIKIMMIDVIVMVDYDDNYTKWHWRLSNDRGDCNGTVNGVWHLASDDEDDDDEEEEEDGEDEDCWLSGWMWSLLIVTLGHWSSSPWQGIVPQTLAVSWPWLFFTLTIMFMMKQMCPSNKKRYLHLLSQTSPSRKRLAQLLWVAAINDHDKGWLI